jgi:hypothetical protein
MKTTVLNNNFPLEITLTIETPEELCDLVGRCNLCMEGRDPNTPYHFPIDDGISWGLWEVLDRLAVRHRLKGR